jgi:2-C-methyl-D-erythritol 4-phosphate cytidylyltransferase
LVEWSIDVLAAFGCDPIVLVVPVESVDGIGASFAQRCEIVIGGDSRQQSVRNGLQRVTSEYVVVHDAARPFVTSEMVDRTLSSLADAEGAIVAIPLDETLKRVDGDVVGETLTRAHLWRVQTPQSFRTAALVQAHDKAAAEGVEVTDDASLIERYGGRVVVVHSTRANMKLTYPEDFVIAEAMLRSRER